MTKGIGFRIIATVLISTACTLLLHRVMLSNMRSYFTAFNKNEQIFLKDTPDYDVLLLGSSRMLSTVNPKMLDSVMGCNSFNLGQNAATIVEAVTNLKGYLAVHKPPQMVVAAVDLHMLNAKKHFSFYPYYLTSTENPAIADALKEDGLKTELYHWLPFLSITEYGDYFKGVLIKNALSQKEMAPGDYYYKGFKSNTDDTLSAGTNAELNAASIPALPVTHIAEAAFEELIGICRKENIRLVCIYAPEYRANNYRLIKNSPAIMAFYRSRLARSGVPMIEHQFLPLDSDSHLFANIGHLNRIGAERYSRILADTLQQIATQSGLHWRSKY